jgi:hypothetical protein
MTNKSTVKFATPSDREIVLTRVFDAPRARVRRLDQAWCSNVGSAAGLVAGDVRGRSAGGWRLALRCAWPLTETEMETVACIARWHRRNGSCIPSGSVVAASHRHR